ncbi:hypothetical protein R6Z07M_002010 [Ovis aries]
MQCTGKRCWEQGSAENTKRVLDTPSGKPKGQNERREDGGVQQTRGPTKASQGPGRHGGQTARIPAVLVRKPRASHRKMPEWVLFHKFSIANSSYIRTASEIAPELFMQLVPRYCFSNLPPSESKDIPQQVMDHLSPISATKKGQKMCDKCSETAEQRCSVQRRCGASTKPDVQHPPQRRRGGRPTGAARTGHGPHGALRGRTLCALLKN